MVLDVKGMEYNVLYKTLDEKEMYFTTGATYIAKYKDPRKHIFSNKPLIYVYHVNGNGNIDKVSYGNLINYKKQAGLEFSIYGWTVDKDTDFSQLDKKETAKEILCSWETMTPLAPIEADLLNIEISNFFIDPIEYFKKHEKHK